MSRHHPAARVAAGMVAGAAAAMLAIGLVDTLGAAIYPPPPEAGLTTVVAADRAVAAMPAGAKLLVLAGLGLGAYVGAMVAAWIVGRRWAVWPMAVLAAANVAPGFAGFAHPSWLMLAGLMLPWPCAAAARSFARHP